MTPVSPSIADAPPAIEISSLYKKYHGIPAVDGLSLRVPQACFYGFLGPNGAGKTTTIKMLMGMVGAESGSIRVLGMEMPGQSLAIRQAIGAVPDDTLLFDYLTGLEYLQFVGRLYGLDRRVARDRGRELLDLFELQEDRKLIGSYSKGMRKRVAMASALIHRPRLFLLDEPFEGVDAVGARLMKSILQEQVSQGATVFLTSHVLEVVERLCDRVAIVHRGKIMVEGAMAALRAEGTGGATTLEEIFVHTIGAEQRNETLDWLR